MRNTCESSHVLQNKLSAVCVSTSCGELIACFHQSLPYLLTCNCDLEYRIACAGAAYCEHAHAVLLSRFQKVAQELDKNSRVEDVAEVQRRLEHIVKVNVELRERVNKAAEVRHRDNILFRLFYLS